MNELYVFLLCLSFFVVFLVFLRFYTQMADKRVEEYKDAFNKGYMTTNNQQPAFVEASEPRVEYLSDEDHFHLEGGKSDEDGPRELDFEDRVEI